MPVISDREPAVLQGALFLAVESPPLVLLGEVGGDHLQDVLGHEGELMGVVLGGEPDQLGLGFCLPHGELLDRLHDH